MVSTLLCASSEFHQVLENEHIHLSICKMPSENYTRNRKRIHPRKLKIFKSTKNGQCATNYCRYFQLTSM